LTPLFFGYALATLVFSFHVYSSLLGLLVVIGIPVLTFFLAAPGRLGLRPEIGLLWSGFQVLVLWPWAALKRRGDLSRAVVLRHRVRVEETYRKVDGVIGDLAEEDPLRLHHTRRIAFFATLWVVGAGLSMPVFFRDFTYGSFPEAPLIFLVDLVVLSLFGRLVTERIALRLLEGTLMANFASGTSRWVILVWAPLAGAIFGAVGALVVGQVFGLTSALETVVAFPQIAGTTTLFAFLVSFSLMSLLPGVILGMVLGFGVLMTARVRKQ